MNKLTVEAMAARVSGTAQLCLMLENTNTDKNHRISALMALESQTAELGNTLDHLAYEDLDPEEGEEFTDALEKLRTTCANRPGTAEVNVLAKLAMETRDPLFVRALVGVIECLTTKKETEDSVKKFAEEAVKA